MASDTRPTKKDGVAREKIALKPGFHLMDWMRLCQSSSDLSGNKEGGSRKITSSELAQHSSQFDCWTAYNGKVYNITQYLPYHPGGDKILMKGAGKDSTDLFNRYHKWVNIESIMGKCYVGVLINEVPSIEENDNEDDDANTTSNGKKHSDNES